AGLIQFGSVEAGAIQFSNAVSGAAQSVPTWVDSMIIRASGNVGIGTTAPNYPLHLETTGTTETLNIKTNATAASGNYGEIAFQTWTNAGSGLNTFGGTGTSRPSVVLRGLSEDAAAQGAFVVATFGGGGGATNATLTEKFRITSAGNVGIATTTPAYPLTVAGTIFSSTGGFRFPDNTVQTTAFAGGTQVTNASYVSAGVFGSNSTKGNYEFQHSNTTANVMYVDATNDRVGIGTTSPSAPLTVENSGSVIARFNSTAANGGSISYQRSGTPILDISTGLTLFGIGTNNDAAIYATGHMYLASDGQAVSLTLNNNNVGIGTTVPSDVLDVRMVNNQTGLTISGLTNGGNGSQPALVFKRYNSGTLYTTANIYGEQDGGGGSIRFATSPTAAKTTPADRMVINSEGNVGIGTTGPESTLDLGSVSGGTNKLLIWHNGNTKSGFGIYNNEFRQLYPTFAVMTFGTQSTADGTTFSEKMRIDGNGNVGIGTTGPQTKFEVEGTGNTWVEHLKGLNSVNVGDITGLKLKIGYAGEENKWAGIAAVSELALGNRNGLALYSNQVERVRIDYLGNVGIGTASPQSKLHIVDTSAAATTLLIGEGGEQPEIRAGGTNTDLRVSAVGTGGWLALQTNAVDRILIVAGGNVGIGSTNPTTAKLVITPGAQPAIDVGSQKIIGLGYPAISTDAASVQYVSDAITNAGITGASSTGAYVLKSGDTMSGNLNMGGNNISGVNKLYVTTIDPIYQIGGVKYATYVSNTIGQKEEVYGKAELRSGLTRIATQKNADIYSYVIDFNKVSVGSDLWLFWQTIAEGKDMKDIVVNLTPQFNGRAWYELRPAQKQIVIYGDSSTSQIESWKLEIGNFSPEVSYHLVAPRHDADEWLNQVDTNEKGIPLNIK
ncbi:hypothetical protein D4R51_01050, partial [bacterium]